MRLLAPHTLQEELKLDVQALRASPVGGRRQLAFFLRAGCVGRAFCMAGFVLRGAGWGREQRCGPARWEGETRVRPSMMHLSWLRRAACRSRMPALRPCSWRSCKQ